MTCATHCRGLESRKYDYGYRFHNHSGIYITCSPLLDYQLCFKDVHILQNTYTSDATTAILAALTLESKAKHLLGQVLLDFVLSNHQMRYFTSDGNPPE